MKYDPNRHHRRSVRLQGYDYAQNGAYFVTVCVHNRECLFGNIGDDSVMQLSGCGEIVYEEWVQTAVIRREVDLDAFVVMPNHVHAIILLTGIDERENQSGTENVGANRRFAPTNDNRPRGTTSGSVGAIMQQFKSVVTKRLNVLRDTSGAPVWQRSYFDRIIRDENSLNLARQYIENNPAKWAEDRENPLNIK